MMSSSSRRFIMIVENLIEDSQIPHHEFRLGGRIEKSRKEVTPSGGDATVGGRNERSQSPLFLVWKTEAAKEFWVVVPFRI